MSRSAPPLPIEECLFGPDGECPTTTNANNMCSNGDDALPPPRRLSKALTGIDDLDEGRWSPTKHVINIQELRRIASQGIVDKGSHRPVAWRVLLGYLPPDTSEWNTVLQKERTLYRHLVGELFVETRHDGNDLRGRRPQIRDDAVVSTEEETEEKMTGQQEERKDDAATTTAGDDASAAETPAKIVKEETDAQVNPTGPEESGETAKEEEDSKPEQGDSMDANDEARKDVPSADPSSLEEPQHQHGDKDSKEQINKATEIPTEEGLVAYTHDEPIPVHTPKGIDGFTELIPARIKEQWKKSGRSSSALEGISGSRGGGGSGPGQTNMNTLLVVDNQGYTPDGSRKNRVTVNDDPLSTDIDSKWYQFFENASLLDEIRKDVVRTHPDLSFFLAPENKLGQRRYAAIERILFVWAKLNKGVRYVQGMNEIVGTIYYVLANDSNEEWACEAEADTYFLFNTLMVEMRDVFVPDLDEADTGIQGRISNMQSLLSLHDPEVRCHLDDVGIDASFYAIRWLTTLLSREFLLPDTIRLWDSMFASTHKDNFLRYVCVTMVMIVRKELLKGDFSRCLRLLQSYPPTNVDDLLESSRALWIYESQITLACHKGGISLQKALASVAPPSSIIMAYGLRGGVALNKSERIRQAGEKSLAAVKGGGTKSANKTASSATSGLGNNIAVGFGNLASGFGNLASGLRTRTKSSPSLASKNSSR